MDEFIAKLNIEHFKKKLATETDPSKKKLLLTLLAEEEAKLAKVRLATTKKPPDKR